MVEQYLTPDFVDNRIARSRGAAHSAETANVPQCALDLACALDALCDHLGIVLIQDVRKRWIIVPANGKGAFVYGAD